MKSKLKESSVIDKAQEKRIEAVHRGFAYQHLYASGCLLLAGSNNVESVMVERDEDIEVDTEHSQFYIQVKTRSSAVQPNDISTSLKRFAEIRKEHNKGNRSKDANFVVVINQEPSPLLAEQMSNGTIPNDVILLWPNCNNGKSPKFLPPAWVTLSEGFRWCTESAKLLPFSLLSPEALVWKITSNVLLACTGDPMRPNHAFETKDLETLFEQLLFQLQDFPVPPSPYFSQIDEPNFDSPNRVRLISAFSGAGKTAWAAQEALLTSHNCAYFDVGDMPGAAIASSLVRDLAARWMNESTEHRSKVLMPGNTGIESLQALDIYLRGRKLKTIIVIDNAHRVAAHELRKLIDATKFIQFFFLCQPSDSTQQLAVELNLQSEPLLGWDLDTIAAETLRRGATGSMTSCNRLQILTGGLPLFVQSAIDISITDHAGDIEKLCNAIESMTHLTETPQEIILAKTFKNLPKETQDVLGVGSLFDIPMSKDEMLGLLKSILKIELPNLAKSIRQLGTAGIVQRFGNDSFKIHDSMRVLGLQYFETFDPSRKTEIYTSIRNCLVDSIQKNHDTEKLPMLTRVFVKLGDIKTLTDLAQDEFFHELGIAAEIYPTLEAAVKAKSLSAEQEFWALDGLIFSDLNSGRSDKLADYLESAEALLNSKELGDSEQMVFLSRKLIYLAKIGNEVLVNELVEQCAKLVPDRPEHQRILKYTIALAFWELKNDDRVIEMAEALVDEYFTAFGIKISDIVGKNCNEILNKIVAPAKNHDFIKHLADTLELLAKAKNRKGQDSGLLRLHSMKFYTICGAIQSVIRLGQDIADEFVARRDYDGARLVMEQHVIPAIVKSNMIARLLPARSHYAVILAYCGDLVAADNEMQLISAYLPGLEPEQRTEIENQKKIIDSLRTSRPKQWWQEPIAKKNIVPIGRKDPCYCGSGRKYKRCHGSGPS